MTLAKFRQKSFIHEHKMTIGRLLWRIQTLLFSHFKSTVVDDGGRFVCHMQKYLCMKCVLHASKIMILWHNVIQWILFKSNIVTANNLLSCSVLFCLHASFHVETHTFPFVCVKNEHWTVCAYDLIPFYIFTTQLRRNKWGTQSSDGGGGSNKKSKICIANYTHSFPQPAK